MTSDEITEDGSAESEAAEPNLEPVPIGVDAGWAWLVMVAVFIIFFILDGISCTFGILYVDFLDYFNSSKGETAMIGGLLYGIPLLVTPFTCGCIEVAGFRRVAILGGVVTSFVFFISVFANSIMFLTITLGAVSGAFMALSYDAGILCVSNYFDKHRGLATGIAMSSTGVGTFAFAPFLDYLLSTYAWRGCLLILSGMCMNVIACGAVFRPLEYIKPENVPLLTLSASNNAEEKEIPIEPLVTQESSPKQLLREFVKVFRMCFDKRLFRHPKWVIFLLSNALYCTSFGFPYIYIPHLAIVNGIPEEQAALLLSVLGIGTTVSLIASAAAVDYTKHVILLYACSMICSGSSLIVYPFISGNYLAMCCITVLFSIGVGANYSMGTLLIIEIVGLEDLVIAYGQLGFIQGIATTFGTPSGGWIYDAVGTYVPAFIAAGAVVLLSGVVLLPFPFMQARSEYKRRKSSAASSPTQAAN